MDDHMLGFTMHMSVKWSYNISFIFESWTALEDEPGYLVLGFALSILICVLSVALPSLRGQITQRLFRKKQESSLLIKESDSQLTDSSDDDLSPQSAAEHIFGFFYIFTYSLLHIGAMMLIMTYNGYVIITVIVGLTLGYTLFGMECDKDKNLPVNCCA